MYCGPNGDPGYQQNARAASMRRSAYERLLAHLNNRPAIRKAVASISGTRTLALADQAVVSATSFITSVMVGRATVPSQLGMYALASSILIFTLNVQEALVSDPYTARRHEAVGTQAHYVSLALLCSGLLSLLSAIILGLGTLGMWAGGLAPEFVALGWVLAAVAPFALVRHFGRQIAFAHLDTRSALIMDISVAVIQCALLGGLAWCGLLSAPVAIAVIGGAVGITGVIWLYWSRRNFTFHLDQLSTFIQRSWSFGKWLLANQLVLVVQTQVGYWLLAGMADISAAGLYAASMSIASLANPLLQGLGNTLNGKASIAFHEGGGSRLLRETAQDAVLLGAPLVLFVVVILFAGGNLLHLLYGSDQYAGQHQTITVLALSLMVSAFGMPAISGLTIIGQPRLIFVTGALAVAANVLVALGLVQQWGALGAAFAMLAGNTIRACTRWTLFVLFVVPRSSARGTTADLSHSTRAAAEQALQGWTKSSNSQWDIELIDQGAQSKILLVRSADGQRILGTYDKLVLKLYHPTLAADIEMVQSQFDSLSRLHGLLNGSIFHGWTVQIPSAVSICALPSALLMTQVAGRKLTFYLENEELPAEILNSASRALFAAMQAYWATGQQHGDSALHNILCDPASRILSFVDSGFCVHCRGARRTWDPAVHDVSRVLADVALCVWRTTGNPTAQTRKEAFTEGLLRSLFETLPQEQLKQKVKDVRDCARLHIQPLERSLSPRSIWDALKRRIAYRRIDAVIARSAPGADGRSVAKVGHAPSQSITLMAKTGLLVQNRDIKRPPSVEPHHRTEERRLFEQEIVPFFRCLSNCKDILLVECPWDTRRSSLMFEQAKSWWTFDRIRRAARYRTKRHIVDSLENVRTHFDLETLDLILCNIVLGSRLDKADAERAFNACVECLRPGGVLVIAFNGAEERRPFRLSDCQSLRALEPFTFPPPGPAEFVTTRLERHAYTAFVKPPAPVLNG